MSRDGSAALALVEAPRLVAGRYQIERELARGAMGVVYRSLDLSSGQPVALKRLLSSEPRLVRMFEREYHALVGLKHPRIIEVHAYGIDVDTPYYTMELLSGTDLRELAPLDYREACCYLRDVASSLGLLHARRMLHRDVSPRNVRVTGDGHCKLIDFGGLSNFGIPDTVVGTPPCVPPEALHLAALDQRADLYSLGALAYFLLTGRHAYPSRELATLPTAWRSTPLDPSEVVASLGNPKLSPIPHELDELVMSLLTLNPFGRPATAADVIDRLVRMGGLSRAMDEIAAQSYLLGGEGVGRKRERQRLHKRMSETIHGHGGCIVIEAAPGMGSTRLLSELTIEAQLLGALPVVLDGAAQRGPYGAVHALVDKLLIVARDDALAAARAEAPILARFSPRLQDALGAQPDDSDLSATPGELRQRWQAALSAWLLAFVKRRPMLLAIDDAHRVDDASAALLATLASAASAHSLLMVACHKPGEVDSAPAAVHALHQVGARMVLRGLAREQVHELTQLWFGTVENTGRLADAIHRLSGGNPQVCLDLAQHLVRNNIIRYIQGSWVLPQEFSAQEMPTSLEQMLQRRVSELSTYGRTLAEALSVHRGRVPLERCLALAEAEGVAEPFAVLEGLCRDGVLVSSGATYQFGHDSLRQVLLASLDSERRKRLHLCMGGLIERAGLTNVDAMLDAGWHLLHGGDEQGGARLLADAGLQLTFATDELAGAISALRAALDVNRRAGRPPLELLRLLTPLTMASYYVDRKLADQYGPEALAAFEHVLGLKLAAKLRPVLGRHLSLYIGLVTAALRFILAKGAGGIAGLRRTITNHIACMLVLVGGATICLDAEKARRYADRIEPLTALPGKDHGAKWTYWFGQLLASLPQERVMEVIDGCRELLQRLEDPRPIPDVPADARKTLHGGVLYALGSMEAFRDGPGALECARKLDALGLKLHEMVADQLRTIYHALRGEVAQAETHRARVEMHAVRAGSAWQVEIWVPASMIMVYVLTLDTIGLKRTMEQLDRLAQEVPSLRGHALLARAEYLHIKGDHEAAFRLAWPHLQATPDRGFIGYSFALANHARGLNHTGRHAEAKALLLPLIAQLTDAEHGVVAVYSNLLRELAHAHAGLGDHDAAFAVVDELLERHKASDHPLLMGNLHATAAAIAVDAGQPVRALDHVTRMAHWFRPTANPALVTQCERMIREVRRLVDDRAASAEVEALDGALEEGSDHTGSARSILSQCQGPEERAEFALRLLLDHVRGRSGFLFSYVSEELSLSAPQHGEEPPTELLVRLRSEIAGNISDDESDAATVVTRGPPSSSLPPPMPDPDDRQVYRTYLLTMPGREELCVIGAFAVALGERALRSPQQAFLQAIARSLFEAGDAGSTDTRTR